MAVINATVGVAVIFGAPSAYNSIAKFVAEDPFIGIYKRSLNPIDETIGIRMDDVELRDFKGPKLISSAHAGRIDIRRDRKAITLYDVKRGLYAGGRMPITYSASRAVWNVQTRMVTVAGGVAVKGKDLDLKADGLTFEDRRHELRVQGKVKGRLYDGQVLASEIVYNADTGAAEAGPVEWQGTADTPTAAGNTAPKKWDIKSAAFKSLGSNTNTTIYKDITASDDDMIVVAPIGQYNKSTDVLTASGGIFYYSGQADLTADSCIVYRKEKRVVLSGHVFMYVKPKSHEDDPPKIEKLPEFKPVSPDQVVVKQDSTQLTQDQEKQKENELRDSKNLRDFPMVVVSDRTEYWYEKGKRHAVITGSPQGRQTLTGDEWRHMWSNSALYDGERDRLTLIGKDPEPAREKNSVGDDMMCDTITVSTKEGDDYMEGSKARGKIYSSEELPSPKSSKSGTTPPPAGGSSGPPKTGG